MDFVALYQAYTMVIPFEITKNYDRNGDKGELLRLPQNVHISFLSQPMRIYLVKMGRVIRCDFSLLKYLSIYHLDIASLCF